VSRILEKSPATGASGTPAPDTIQVVRDWLRAKIKDGFVTRELEKRGWKVLVAWEHEFKTNKDVIGEKLDLMLGSSAEVSE
jgi:G:T-mismatch repair DNA endonuclease (very short patch repair protein)